MSVLSETDERSLLVILHIHRTAGLTLRKALRNVHGPAFQALKWPSAAPLSGLAASIGPDVRIVQGHINYGLADHLDRPASYATLLRDPVARTLSHFRLINHMREQAGRSPVPLDRFIGMPGSGNLQTELIAGTLEREQLGDAATYDRALAHLKAFLVIGIFPDLPAYSAALGAGALKPRNSWGEPPVVSSAQMRSLRARTELDQALYDWAVRRAADARPVPGERPGAALQTGR